MKKIMCFILSMIIFILSINITSVFSEDSVAKFYCAENFESGTIGSILPVHLDYNENHKMKIEIEDGNHYFRSELLSGTAGYFDFVIPQVSGRTLIFEFDYKTFYNNGNNMEFMDVQSATGTWSQNFCYDGLNKKYKLCTGGSELPVTVGKWEHFAFVFNLSSHMVDVYKNKVRIVNGLRLANNISDIYKARISFLTRDVGAAVGVDNLYIYEAEKPFDNVEEAAAKSFGSCFARDESKVKEFLGDVSTLCVDSGNFYENSEKIESVGECIKTEKQILVTLETATELLNTHISYNSAEQIINISDIATMRVGENGVNKGTNTIYCDVAPMIINGRVYIPLEFIASDILNKKVFVHDNRLFFVSDSAIDIDITNSEMMDMAYRYLMYDRLQQGQLEEYLSKKSHPRLMVSNERTEQIKGWLKTSETAKNWYNTGVARIKSLGNPPFTYFNSSNNSILYFRTAEEYVISACMLYRLTGDEKYARAAWTEINHQHGFPNWNVAHALDTASILVAQATAYDFLYDWLTAEQRQQIADSIVDKGLKPLQNTYSSQSPGNSYVRGNDNWVSVVNSGVILACLAIGDRGEYREICDDVFRSATMALEYLFKHFAPDGAWYEGPGYTIYTMQYLRYALSSLNLSLGTCLNYDKSIGLKNVPWFLLNLSGPMGYNMMHNTGAQPIGNIKYANEGYDGLWWSDYYKNPALTVAIINHMKIHQMPGGIDALMMTNLDYENVPMSEVPVDAMYRNVEYGLLRSNDFGAGKELWVSFHGGSNDFGHAHLDAGTFTFDALGERWACDIGSDSYSLPEWGASNAKYYCVRAEGHNVPVINPDYGPDQAVTSELSRITEFESGENGGYAILDLTPAYQKNATKASRGFYLADLRRSLIIRDEFILKKANSEIYWFMQLEKNTAVEIHGNYAILSKNGKKMRVDFVTNATGAVISETEAKNLPTSPQYTGTYDTTELYKKLAIRMKASGALNITVKLTPLDGSTNNFTVMDIPLENWKDEFESNADVIDWESVKFIRSDRTYSNGDYVWSDPIEHSYGYINDHSKVGAKISLINSAEVDCEALGIVAIYNEFDRLTWLKKISITIPRGKNEFTLLSEPIPNTHGMKIKMFILEDMETMRPFTQSFYLWKKSSENNGPVPQCTPVLYKQQYGW